LSEAESLKFLHSWIAISVLTFAVSVLTFAVCETSQAITINVEYPAGTLFTNSIDLIAKPAINAAAADLSAAITSTLNAINTDAYTGTNGQTTATLGFQFRYNDPTTNNPVTIPNAVIGANSVIMYVGTRNLSGTTLGVGGPGHTMLDQSQFAFGGSSPHPSQWVGAVGNAETLSETAYKRGGGPLIGTATGSATLGNVTANINVDYTITHGVLSLDGDTNNNGMKDNDSEFNNYWHFNHMTPVAAGKNDLYSVALHEMLHALGIGASSSWTSKVSGNNWIGSEVSALYGSGAGLVSSGHIAEGIMSTSIVNGAPQEVVMDPTITTGTRKYLTALDLAFLRDIGYSTIIPNPSFSPADFDEDGDVDGTDLLTWRNAYATNATGDTDNDGDTDGRDFLTWQREYTGAGALAAGTAVPEPGLAVMAITALLCCSGMRRR
jgi:hypothetical protein